MSTNQKRFALVLAALVALLVIPGSPIVGTKPDLAIVVYESGDGTPDAAVDARDTLDADPSIDYRILDVDTVTADGDTPPKLVEALNQNRELLPVLVLADLSSGKVIEVVQPLPATGEAIVEACK